MSKFLRLAAVLLSLTLFAWADGPASNVLLDTSPGVEKRLTPSSPDVTVAPGALVTIAPGNDNYPGVALKPPGVAWDLSAFGHVEARITNTGTGPLNLALRVDNAGNWQDNPWNTESIDLKPGETGTITTIFGYAYGRKPGYALNPAAVVQVLLFTGKADATRSFRIESIVAAGPKGEAPPVDPASIRVKPPGGVLLGAGVTIDAGTQIEAKGAAASLDGQSLRAAFTAQGDQSVTLKPTVGRWDLRDDLQVRLKVRNDGQTPVTPRARIESNGGPSDWIDGAPLAPGGKGEIIVPFASATTANLSQKDTGNKVTSDAVSGVTLAAPGGEGERSLLVDEIKAEMPSGLKPADWLGQRPPVAGDWVKTLDDEFDGPTLDSSVWSVYGPNYWDKPSHWSKDDVLMGNGVVKLHYEKKTGFNDDDPKEKQTPYAAGYLHTFDKWAQRYGYFEARMKLPKSPGLWPAFWMMPDRGREKGDQGGRQDTGNGGMEFDIMEHLTRWGPNRYNIAMHYDGYGKDHKSLGSDKIYVQPDKDGFITCGLLWTPGSAIYYCQGKEVLRWEDPRISNVPEMLMFTLPQGGWDNSPIEDKRLPDDLVVDYVRVWQRKDLASATDGKKPPL